jgi:hypothetical protein
MDAKDLGSLAEVISVSSEGPLDVDPFELVECLVEQYLPIKHLINQRLKARAHLHEYSQTGRKSP